ncbi:MAG: hydrogenase/urease maturation nickel metallochaperone HypA [Pseudomonadota bacterium]
MHEVGIVQNLVKELLERIESKKLTEKPTKIFITLGDGLRISEESLNFWFNDFAKNTVLEGAKLQVTAVDGNKIIIDSLEVE